MPGFRARSGISGQFIGLLLGGLLALWDWRAVFWVSVLVGLPGHGVGVPEPA